MTNRDDSLSSEAGNHASVNGLDMYYEIHGSDEPLVLLYGVFRQSAPLSEGRGRRILGSSHTAACIALVRLP
jgi:hypothetical protein